jgi:hypothetical protein
MTDTRTSDQHAGGAAAPKSRRWRLLVALALAQLMIALDTTAVTIALSSASWLAVNFRASQGCE